VVHLFRPLPATHPILELPLRRCEGIAKRHEHILVGMVEMMLLVDDDLAAGHADIDADGVEPALAVVPVGLGDDDMAAGDPAVGVLELVDVLEYLVTDGLVDRDVVEGDLGLSLHGGDAPVKTRLWKQVRENLKTENNATAPCVERAYAAGRPGEKQQRDRRRFSRRPGQTLPSAT